MKLKEILNLQYSSIEETVITRAKTYLTGRVAYLGNRKRYPGKKLD